MTDEPIDKQQLYEQLEEAGEQYVSEGDLENAIACFDAMLQQKRTAYGLLLLAQAYRLNHEPEEAHQCISEAIAMEEENHWLRFELGLIFMQWEKWEEAYQPISEMVKLEPKNDLFLAHYGLILYHLGEYDEAIDVCTRALNVDPNFVMALEARGDSHAALDRFEAAREDFALASEYATDLEDVYRLSLSHAWTLLRLNAAEEALRLCLEVAEQAPDYLLAYQLMGDTFVDMDKLDEAVKAYSMAIDLAPNHAINHLNRHAVFLKLGDEERAAVDLARARELDPDIE